MTRLQLGDIIQLINTDDNNNNAIDNDDDAMDDKPFHIIDYIDASKIKVYDLADFTETIVPINRLPSSEYPIIRLIYRAPTMDIDAADDGLVSYALHHGLTSGTFVNVYFKNGATITGQIVALVKDEIEIECSLSDPEKTNIFINFDYIGLPEELDILCIEPTEKPLQKASVVDENENDGEEEEAFIDRPSIGRPGVLANEAFIGRPGVLAEEEDLKDLEEQVFTLTRTVQQSQPPHSSIDEQVDDLVHKLLGCNINHSQGFLQNIHLSVQRYTQLREKFSTIDAETGLVVDVLKHGITHKPLMNYFSTFSQNLYWILPVVNSLTPRLSDMQCLKQLHEESTATATAATATATATATDGGLSSDQKVEIIQQFFEKKTDPFISPIYSVAAETNIHTVFLNAPSASTDDTETACTKFYIQRFNKASVNKLYSKNKNINDVADILNVVSFLTLPEPTILFSKINLPETSLLVKANLNLHFLNYWELLKNTTMNDERSENNNERSSGSISKKKTSCWPTIVNYFKRNASKKYAMFVNEIVHDTREIIECMQKHMHGNLSIVDAVSFLEPFLIYTDDLSIANVTQLNEIIRRKTKEFMQLFFKEQHACNKLFTKLTRLPKSTETFDLIKLATIDLRNAAQTETNRTDIWTSYFGKQMQEGQQQPQQQPQQSVSELLKDMLMTDFGNYFTSMIAFNAISLMADKEIYAAIVNDLPTNAASCAPVIVAKRYNDSDDDDHKIPLTTISEPIYFDKDLDTTNYGILNSFEKELLSMTTIEFIETMTSNLQKTMSLTTEEAVYLTTTLVEGRKRVIDGQYAINTDSNLDFQYYKFVNNEWILDKEMTDRNTLSTTGTTDPFLFCEFKKTCTNVENEYRRAFNSNNCVDTNAVKKDIKNKFVNEIVTEFDRAYQQTVEILTAAATTRREYFKNIMSAASRVRKIRMFKYNNAKYAIGVEMTIREGIIVRDDNVSFTSSLSPHAELLALLNDDDLTNIARFASTFTRPAKEGESPHWHYCKETNLALIPSFKVDIARMFCKTKAHGGSGSNEFGEFLTSLADRLGDGSNASDWIVDKNTGWRIMRRPFVEREEEEEEDEAFIGRSGVLAEEEDERPGILAEINGRPGVLASFIGRPGVLAEDDELTFDAAAETAQDTLDAEVISAIASTIKIMTSLAKPHLFFNQKMTNAQFDHIENSAKKMTTICMPEIIRLNEAANSFDAVEQSKYIAFLWYIVYFTVQSSNASMDDTYKHFEDLCSTSKSHMKLLRKNKFDKYIATFLTKQHSNSDSVRAANADIFLKPIQLELKRRQRTRIAPARHLWPQFLPPMIPFEIEMTQKQRHPSRQTISTAAVLKYSMAIQQLIQKVVQTRETTSFNNCICQQSVNDTTIDFFKQAEPEIETYNQRVNAILTTTTSPRDKGVCLYVSVNSKNPVIAVSNKFSAKTLGAAFHSYCKMGMFDENDICARTPGRPMESSFARTPGRPMESSFATTTGRPMESSFATTPGRPMESSFARTPGRPTPTKPTSEFVDDEGISLKPYVQWMIRASKPIFIAAAVTAAATADATAADDIDATDDAAATTGADATTRTQKTISSFLSQFETEYPTLYKWLVNTFFNWKHTKNTCKIMQFFKSMTVHFLMLCQLRTTEFSKNSFDKTIIDVSPKQYETLHKTVYKYHEPTHNVIVTDERHISRIHKIAKSISLLDTPQDVDVYKVFLLKILHVYATYATPEQLKESLTLFAKQKQTIVDVSAKDIKIKMMKEKTAEKNKSIKELAALSVDQRYIHNLMKTLHLHQEAEGL